MAETEAYKTGNEIRRKLMGDAYVERMAQTVYTDEVMAKFGAYATEAVFGKLWSRPGLDLKTRTLICVISDTVMGRPEELEDPSEDGAAAGLDGGRAGGGHPASERLLRPAAGARGAACGARNLRRVARRGVAVALTLPSLSRPARPSPVMRERAWGAAGVGGFHGGAGCW